MGGYRRGNCEYGNRKYCSAADIAASESLEACESQCSSEPDCKFIAFKSARGNGVCSRYDQTAGDCSNRVPAGGYTLMKKDCTQTGNDDGDYDEGGNGDENDDGRDDDGRDGEDERDDGEGNDDSRDDDGRDNDDDDDDDEGDDDEGNDDWRGDD